MDKKLISELTENGKIDLSIIYEYCIEMGKDPELTKKFITYLVQINPYFIGECFEIALEYYQVKFNICILYAKDGRIIKTY